MPQIISAPSAVTARETKPRQPASVSWTGFIIGLIVGLTVASHRTPTQVPPVPVRPSSGWAELSRTEVEERAEAAYNGEMDHEGALRIYSLQRDPTGFMVRLAPPGNDTSALATVRVAESGAAVVIPRQR